MGVWHKLLNLIKNGEKGQSEVLRFFTFVIIALLIIALIIPPLFGLFAPRLTTASAIELLQSEGYWVLAQGACYPGDFIPCVNGTQSLGSDTQRWKDLWLSAPTIYLGNVTISNSGSQIDIDGQLVMHDEGKVWMEIQPDLDYATVIASGKPTQVYRGASSGFSLPIYNDDNEELFVSMDVPREWDGITDPIAHVHCYIPEDSNGMWILPTDFTDYGGWTDETLSYDSDKKTFSYNSIAGTSWSEYLEFDIASAIYDKVRFYAKYDVDNINTIDIDAYYGGAWNDVYQGTYESMSWISKDLGGEYTVTKYRIRFYNTGVNPKDARLYESSLCTVAGQGNFNLELGYSNYNVGANGAVPDEPTLETMQTATISGSYKSYVVEIVIDATGMTTCDQLDLRLRRIEATEFGIDSEVVITHIGVQWLRDKLGEITP